MAQANRPDTWDASSQILLTIQKKGGSKRHFRTTVISTDKTGGVKDFDSFPNYAGGYLKGHKDATPIELTFEGHATEIGTDSGEEGLGFDDLMNSQDESQPLSVSLDNSKDEYIVVYERTTNSTATDAMAATTDGDRATRYQFKNGHFTDVVWNDTGEKVLKYTLKFKLTPADRDGNSNYIAESTNGTASAILPEITYS